VVASHVPYTMEGRKHRDILLWKSKVELADLEARAMELVHTIAKLEQEAAAAEIVRGPDRPTSETSKTLSHGRGTSSITIFIDVDESERSRTPSRGLRISGDGDCREGSEETRTLSHGRDMSEASDKWQTSKCRYGPAVSLLTSNQPSMRQRPTTRVRSRMRVAMTRTTDSSVHMRQTQTRFLQLKKTRYPKRTQMKSESVPSLELEK
jgi:hypothetical protein